MKKIMLGNEAVARGLYEAGVRFVSSYPGTPSTEISEFAAKYDEIYAEWAPNEKVALEASIGASFGGGRAFSAMKHVGLNVAADPLFITAYTGVGGGLVIGVADDPGMHSSQNEQDSRHYAIGAKLPMIEPADAAECKEFTKLAYTLSEQFDTPFILRLTTRVSHSGSAVELEERQERERRRLEVLNQVLTLNQDGETSDMLRGLVQECRNAMEDLRQRADALRQRQTAFFRELKTVGDLIELKMPEPDEIELLGERRRDVLDTLKRCLTKRGIRPSPQIRSILQRELSGVDVAINREAGGLEYRERLTGLLSQLLAHPGEVHINDVVKEGTGQ